MLESFAPYIRIKGCEYNTVLKELSAIHFYQPKRQLNYLGFLCYCVTTPVKVRNPLGAVTSTVLDFTETFSKWSNGFLKTLTV